MVTLLTWAARAASVTVSMGLVITMCSTVPTRLLTVVDPTHTRRVPPYLRPGQGGQP
jgi:hypothetical protein